jgi:hypothetical protein
MLPTIRYKSGNTETIGLILRAGYVAQIHDNNMQIQYVYLKKLLCKAHVYYASDNDKNFTQL